MKFLSPLLNVSIDKVVSIIFFLVRFLNRFFILNDFSMYWKEMRGCIPIYT